MRASVDCPYRIYLEIRRGPGVTDPPIHLEEVTADLAALFDETHTRAVLAGAFPPAAVDPVAGRLEVVWADEPFVRRLDVELETASNGERLAYGAEFVEGPWSRRALLASTALTTEGVLEAGELTFARLIAERQDETPSLPLPPLEAPIVEHRPLAGAGVRELGEGSLDPHRPVLVDEALEEELLAIAERAGLKEAGGAVLGQLVRLPEPLPGTATPIVTVLSTLVCDERHVGEIASFTFSPEALAEAARVAEVRGMGERVLTVAHTHGWSETCGPCQRTDCAIPECTYVSPQDYALLESLFPSKSSLLPIAGRKRGVSIDRPVLEIHGWRGGRVEALPWLRYRN